MEPSHFLCPACGAQSDSVPLAVPDYEYGLEHVAQYAGCSACLTLFQQPMPSLRELASFYPPTYHAAVGQGWLGRLRHDLRLRRLLALGLGRGAVLDYGCGNGDFLVRAAARSPGRRYFGFEVSEQRESVTRAEGAVTIFRGDVDGLIDMLPECSLITMNHVIEHLPDPASVLARLLPRLAPGGVLEGQTPASDSLEHRVFGSRWSGFHAPRHTVVFSRAGLARMLGTCGFADVKVTTAFNPAGLAVSLASLSQAAGRGSIRRAGAAWLAWLALASVLAPIDLLSGSPAIVDFSARRPAKES